MTTLWNWSSHGGQDEDNTFLQRSQRCHKDEFRHVRISTRQRSLRCGQKSSWAFPESYTADDSSIVRSSDGGHGETKGFITPPSVTESLHDSDHEGVVRIFVALSCELWGLFNYITLHYAAQFLPYEECNIYAAQFSPYHECNITRHNFSPNRSVTSGNHTPGSRFYSDPLDTIADFVYIHQLILKHCWNRLAARIIVSG